MPLGNIWFEMYLPNSRSHIPLEVIFSGVFTNLMYRFRYLFYGLFHKMLLTCDFLGNVSKFNAQMWRMILGVFYATPPQVTFLWTFLGFFGKQFSSDQIHVH